MGVFDWFKGFDWNPDPSDVSEPLPGKKALGWQVGDKPPAQNFNWFWAKVSAAFKRIGDTQIPLLRTRAECVSDGMQGRVFCYQPESESVAVVNDGPFGFDLDLTLCEQTESLPMTPLTGTPCSDGQRLFFASTSVVTPEIMTATPDLDLIAAPFAIADSNEFLRGVSSDGQVVDAITRDVSSNYFVSRYSAQNGNLITKAALPNERQFVVASGEYAITWGRDPGIDIVDSAGAVSSRPIAEISTRVLDVCVFGGWLFAVGFAGGGGESIALEMVADPATRLVAPRDGKDTRCCATDGNIVVVGGENTASGNNFAVYSTSTALLAEFNFAGTALDGTRVHIDDKFIYAVAGDFTYIGIFDKRTLERVTATTNEGGKGWTRTALDAWGLYLFKQNEVKRLWIPGHHDGFKRMVSMGDPLLDRVPSTRVPFNHAVLPVR